MKKKLISLCLALVMVLSLLPVTAFAAENEPISAFAELKAQIASGADQAVINNALVIEEDLVLPEYFSLMARDVVIPAGVTLTVRSISFFSADDLTVDGTLIIDHQVDVSGSLTINGTVELNGILTLNHAYGNTCVLTGKENIIFGQSYTFISNYQVDDGADLPAALDAAAAETDSRLEYRVTLYGSYTADRDLYVPANTQFQVSGGLTIPQGCTLTLGGYTLVYGSLTIKGTLEQNASMVVSPYMGGKLTVTETGEYKGSGGIAVQREGVEALEDVIIGLDLSEFDITEYDYYWYLSYVGPSIGGDIPGGFTSIEELIEMIESDPTRDFYDYAGTAPLIISQDLTIPANVTVNVWRAPVTIANGVTVTLDGILDCIDLTVNGTLVNNCIIYAYDNLTVNGKLENNRLIVLEEYTNLSGENKIVYNAMENGYPSQLHRYYYPETIEQLVDCIKGLSASDDKIHWNVIQFYGEGAQVLDQDLHIPKQTELTLVDCTFTVSKGATLTVDGGLEVWFQPLIVEGTLVNNNYIDLYYSYGASMRVANSGSYKGSGEIGIFYPDPDELEEAIEGLDLSSFDAVYDEEYYGWYLTPKAEAHTHSWDAGTVTTAATCTADGVMTYTCACGETKTEAIPAKGHSEVTDAAVEATCTASGKTEGKHCGVCGEVLTAQEIIPAKGHSEVTDAAVEATCTASGKTAGKHCGVCGEVLTAQEIIPAKGHTYENGTCVNCGKAEEVTEVALGDASGDGVINNIDAMQVLQYAVGLRDADTFALSACDVNNDGVVNNIDAMLILQYAVGLITEFPNAKA